MSETSSRHTNLPEPRIVLLTCHAVQLVLAVVILGLDAYGIHYVAYTGLICSQVIALCTILTCAYLLASQSIFRNLYRFSIVLGHHTVMLIFWAVNLGLIASVAKLWEGPPCTYSYRDGYKCAPYGKRDAGRTHTTQYKTYYGALIAGAVLAAFEFALWTLTAILMFSHGRKKELSDPLPISPRVTHSDRISMSQLRSAPPSHSVALVAPWINHPVPLTPSDREFVIPDIEEDAALPLHAQEPSGPLRGPLRTNSAARETPMQRQSTGPGEMAGIQR